MHERLNKLYNVVVFTKDKKSLINDFTNIVHYQVFKHLPLKNVKRIYLSENYIVLEFNWKINRIYVKQYVLGINSDDKLFINPITLIFDEEETEMLELVNDIHVCKIKDEDIRRSLDYDKEATDIIKQGEILRVQGDLLFRVRDKENYFYRIEDILSDELDRVLSNIILRRIQRLLGEKGITSEILNNAHDLYLTFIIPKRIKEKERDELISKLVKYISDNLYVRDILNLLKINEVTISREYKNTLGINIRLKNIFVSPYLSLMFNVYISRNAIHQLANEILKDVTYEYNEQVIDLGRHKIKYIGYPSNFVLRYSLPLQLEEHQDYYLPITLEMLYFKGNTFVEIIHPEHGINKYYVPVDVVVIIGNILNDRGFLSRLSYYALKYNL